MAKGRDGRLRSVSNDEREQTLNQLLTVSKKRIHVHAHLYRVVRDGMIVVIYIGTRWI